MIYAVLRCLCQQVAYEAKYLPADFLAIATQGLVNAKYRGSQILPRVLSAQRGMGARFHCLPVKAIATQQHSAILVDPPYPGARFTNC
jgi:hypothetical protein